MTHPENIPLKWLLLLTFVVMVAMLLIGIKPSDLLRQNNVKWISKGNGLQFGKYGIAFTGPIAEVIGQPGNRPQAFSIEIACRPQNLMKRGFHFIFLLHSGANQDQMLIGQWGTLLIVMNGDDYSYRKKTPRISADLSARRPAARFLTVTSGAGGTMVYLDGRPAAVDKGLQLHIPKSEATRLILGNSASGRHPWTGDIYGVAMYGDALSAGDVMAHFNRWTQSQRFAFPRAKKPLLLYPLDEKTGNTAANALDDATVLRFPAKMDIPAPRFFFDTWTPRIFAPSHLLSWDGLINFLGFIPLGFLLAASLTRSGGRLENRRLPLAVAVGFVMSLWIETVQAWMPARSSDVQDLVLNTLGTFAGALILEYWSFAAPKAKRQNIACCGRGNRNKDA